jgi:hypothetical protein
MPQYTYSDIPDTVVTKPMIPIGEHIWNIVKEYGWEWFVDHLSGGPTGFYPDLGDAVNEKFQFSVKAAKKVLDGKMEDPSKVFSTWFFPPLIYVRSDLQTGSTKLIYGDSTDITFIVMSDITSKVNLLINAHMEDGIPVDYWYIKGDDEIFDRRHMKLGFPLRDIPKRTKDVMKSGNRIIDILRDVRNERSPQWSDSAYATCMVWVSGGINIQSEFSNWGDLANVWDGLSSKRIYGTPDYWFCYVPWPPLLGTLINIGRGGWTVRMTGLLTDFQLILDPFEPKLKKIYTNIPEFWAYTMKGVKERGVATPSMILNCHPPDLKDKKVVKREEFNWTYPEGSRIKPFEWDLTEDEVFGGIVTDITHDTPPEEFYGKEHITSIGIGKKD